MTATITVDLGDRAYDILVGPSLIANAGEHLSKILRRPKVVVVTDENVAAHHLGPLQSALEAKDISVKSFILPAGEKTKSFPQLQSLCSDLLQAGVERNDMIVALGGGVIGDLTGFAASILRRGVDFIQIPTTLLAQVDSSVGGKTGINTPEGKNLIGAFHQPQLVLADTGALKTLSTREFIAGYAEVVKYGLINDLPFFNWLEANVDKIKSGDEAARIHAITKSCQAKADIVAQDEKEGGVRALLNLGHTFGHALEAATSYTSERLVHGEGVSIGMTLAMYFSQHLGLCSGQDAQRAENHMKAAGLPTRMEEIPGELPDTDALINLMAQDKKVVDGQLTFILTKAIGESFITREIATSDLHAFLSSIRKDA